MDFDYEKYLKSVHRWGRFLLGTGVVLLVSAPFIFSKISGAHIIWSGFFKAIGQVALIYVPSAIVEFLIYVPMMGAGGCYVLFLTGNITNLKLPCVFNSREIAKTRIGTPEDEITSTLSVATSALVTMLVIFIGVLLLIPLTPILQNPFLQPAFSNVVPALFGALAMQYFVKNYWISIFAMVLMTVVCVVFPSLVKQTGVMLLPVGGLSIAFAYILYRNRRLDNDRL